ncbi:30S ribosomal protein S4, partial [candidate division WOR-1 bacterium RIFOXYD2_FULL_41_8]
ENEKLFLKGEKCSTEKCPFTRRSYAPGQHGKRPIRPSEYGVRLREKQKARRIYGLTESQFEKYFDEASSRKGATGEKLLEFLERRLDNVVFRLGFVTSRQAARQLVHHGGIVVDDTRVDVPSFRVKTNQVIKVGAKGVQLVKTMMEKLPDHTPPVWLTLTGEQEGKVLAMPKREDIDTVLEDHYIVEYYSR